MDDAIVVELKADCKGEDSCFIYEDYATKLPYEGLTAEKNLNTLSSH